MLIDDNCVITNKEEKKIVKLLNINPPECFEKITEKEIESIQKVVNVNENVIKKIRDIVIKNKIYESLLKVNKINLFKDFETKNIIEISNECFIPPLYLLKLYTTLKYHNNETTHFLKNEIDAMQKKIKNTHSKINNYDIKKKILAYNILILTLLNNMGISCIPYEKTSYNNIFIIENKFVINEYRINWIICINDYGCNIEKLYESDNYKQMSVILKNKYGDGGIIYNYGYNEELNKEFDCKLFCYNADKFNYENNILTEKGEFFNYGMKYITGKVTHHYYNTIYPTFINQFKELENSAMLEIGIGRTNALLVFVDYFPKAYIYGIDTIIESKEKNMKIFKATQNNIKQMEKVKDEILADGKKLFLIIDDGDHLPEHQVETFNLYFDSLLMYGGCYIIEDIETTYWVDTVLYNNKIDYGYKHNKSIIEIFKNVVDIINVNSMSKEDAKQSNKDCKIKTEIRNLIMSVTFSQNCIIIKKKSLEQLSYENV